MITIGIDIGHFSIKIAQIAVANKTIIIQKLQEFPLSVDPTKDNKLEVIDFLRNIMHGHDIASTRLVMALPQNKVSVRRRTFPFKERHKILKSVAFELEDDIPFSADNSIFDVKVIEYIGNTADTLAVASPKEFINEILQLASDAGIDPEIISTDGIACANVFENWLDAPPESPALDNPTPEVYEAQVAIVFGHVSTHVLVFKNQRLIDIRTIQWGGKSIAESITSKYKIHFIAAMSELQNKSFILMNNAGATRDQVSFSNLIKASVDTFAQELNLTLIEMKTHYSLNYQNIQMAGGLSQLRNLGPYLTQKLEISTNKIEVLENFPNIDFISNSHKELSFIPALGLAIEGFKKASNPPIQLLKEEFARQSQSLKVFWEKWKHTVQVAVAIYVLFLAYGFLRDNFSASILVEAENQMSNHARTVAGLKGSKANSRNVMSFIREKQREEKNRKAAQELQNINSATDIIKQVSEITPDKKVANINIKKFSVNNEQVLIEGEINSAQALANWQNAIKNITRDGKVDSIPTQIKPTTNGWKSFSLKFRVQRRTTGA